MGQYRRKLAKGERWFYSGQHQGVKYFSKAIYLTKTEAKRAEREKLDEIERLSNPHAKMSLSELTKDRLKEVEAHRSKQYKRDTKFWYDKLKAYLADTNIREISKDQLSRFFRDTSLSYQKAGKTNHAVNAGMRIVKALFGHAHANGLIAQNPMTGLKPYPVRKNLKYIPPDADMDKVRAILNPKQRELFDFVDETACRINEALNLMGEDTEEGYTRLWTRKSRNGDTVSRRIPSTLGARKGKVFPYSDHPEFLERKCEKAGVRPFGWHSLRHRRASIWACSGMPIFEIMQRLGHSNLETTQRYLQLLAPLKNHG